MLYNFRMATTIRDIRKARKLTLKAVATHVGITEGQASRIEREGTGSFSTALKLAELLQVPVELFAPRSPGPN